MGHQELRASQLTGSQISSSSGSEVGTISDVIINPAIGRVDFAVVSLNSSGTSSSATSPSTTSAASSSTGKQIAVPWTLLRPSSMAGAGTSSSTSSTSGSTGQQFSFVFTGDTSKLQSAPNFDANTDLTQPGWRQSVFSYFGVSGRGMPIGGAESPGSSGSSSSESSGSSSSSVPGSSSGSVPQSSGSR